MKWLVGLLLLSVTLTSCGYQGWIRYECQEYANWENPECKAPECKVTGTCTADILGDAVKEKK